SQFYVVKASDTASTINSALASGCNLFFTPGIYHVNQTLNVTRTGTVILGIGYPTVIPDNGVNAMQVADVDGVRIKGLLFDAGTTRSTALLTVGPSGSTASHAANPTTLQDVFFRIGGASAGKATTSLVVNSNNVIIDHTWAWRADHGNTGTVGWTINTADTGVLVNGNDVLATGLFVEHYQKFQVIWNGQNGKTIFFQNEMPYDVPDQASWNSAPGVNGFAAYKVGTSVTTHEAWGMGSYCFFNVNPAVSASHAFEVPNVSGVRFHDSLTVSLNFQGVITHVINNTGATTPSGTVPVNVVSFP
ncbi:MAG TPA: coagulation factor 5/8 type domain-containing protein, partial [Kofleriaceae bacterium]|nr:coagulation factor 5/8 type domain-containing protein [Kofleriaceae bacterium]